MALTERQRKEDADCKDLVLAELDKVFGDDDQFHYEVLTPSEQWAEHPDRGYDLPPCLVVRIDKFVGAQRLHLTRYISPVSISYVPEWVITREVERMANAFEHAHVSNQHSTKEFA